MSEYWIGEERHTIRVNEIDSTGYATFPALLNLMQEVAWNNSQRLNYSVYDMMERGFTWVVYRMQFEIFGYPKHYEEIFARSWPSGRDRLYTYRDYQVLYPDGSVLVSGTSAWLVFDIEKRKPVAIPPFFQQLEFPQHIERKVIDTSKLPMAGQKVGELVVKHHDMDVNGHTNNACYVEWVLEDLYNQLERVKKPHKIDMIFKGETVTGDELHSFLDKLNDQQSLHLIRKKDTGSEIFQAKILF